MSDQLLTLLLALVVIAMYAGFVIFVAVKVGKSEMEDRHKYDKY